MFTAQLSPAPFRAPWEIGFAERMAMLTRGSPRAIYYCEKPDTTSFRYRVFNITQSLAAEPAGGPSAAWFERSELEHMDHVLELCDVLVICRTRYDAELARLVEAAHARGRTVLFDCDDLVFDPRYAHLVLDTLDGDKSSGAEWDYWFSYTGRLGAAFQLCDGAVVTNPYLADRAREAFGDGRTARVVPNYLERSQQELSARLWEAKERSGWARDGYIHLGYFSGSPTHNRDFALIAGPLARLMDENPRLHLRIVGFLELGPELERHSASRVEWVPLQDYLSLQHCVAATEVSLVPLQDNVFTNCKSALKWFEAAPVGTLTVATPTYTYRDAIEHGRTGWLAPAHKWEQVLRDVLADLDGHGDLLRAARMSSLDRHGWDRQARTITEALFEAAR